MRNSPRLSAVAAVFGRGAFLYVAPGFSPASFPPSFRVQQAGFFFPLCSCKAAGLCSETAASPSRSCEEKSLFGFVWNSPLATSSPTTVRSAGLQPGILTFWLNLKLHGLASFWRETRILLQKWGAQ